MTTNYYVEVHNGEEGALVDLALLHKQYGNGMDYEAWVAWAGATPAPMQEQIFGYSLAEKSARSMLKAQSAYIKDLDTQLKKAKADALPILADALKSITKEDIDAGETFKASPSAKGTDIVTYLVSLAGAKAKEAVKDEERENLDAGVLDLLDKLIAKRDTKNKDS